jgi:hypothetical protein
MGFSRSCQAIQHALKKKNRCALASSAMRMNLHRQWYLTRLCDKQDPARRTAALKRQARSEMTKGMKQATAFWTGALAPTPPTKKKRR